MRARILQTSLYRATDWSKHKILQRILQKSTQHLPAILRNLNFIFEIPHIIFSIHCCDLIWILLRKKRSLSVELQIVIPGILLCKTCFYFCKGKVGGAVKLPCPHILGTHFLFQTTLNLNFFSIQPPGNFPNVSYQKFRVPGLIY